METKLKRLMLGRFDKISFDFDGTLTMPSVQRIAQDLVAEGNNVYIISARSDVSGMTFLAIKLGIPLVNVFATGSDEAKINKIRQLNVTKHYDNKVEVIEKIRPYGVLVKTPF